MKDISNVRFFRFVLAAIFAGYFIYFVINPSPASADFSDNFNGGNLNSWNVQVPGVWSVVCCSFDNSSYAKADFNSGFWTPSMISHPGNGGISYISFNFNLISVTSSGIFRIMANSTSDAAGADGFIISNTPGGGSSLYFGGLLTGTYSMSYNNWYRFVLQTNGSSIHILVTNATNFSNILVDTNETLSNTHYLNYDSFSLLTQGSGQIHLGLDNVVLLSASPVAFSGHIFDGVTGIGIADATVNAWGINATTDSGGYYSMNTPRGSSDVTINASGYFTKIYPYIDTTTGHSFALYPNSNNIAFTQANYTQEDFESYHVYIASPNSSLYYFTEFFEDFNNTRYYMGHSGQLGNTYYYFPLLSNPFFDAFRINAFPSKVWVEVSSCQNSDASGVCNLVSLISANVSYSLPNPNQTSTPTPTPTYTIEPTPSSTVTSIPTPTATTTYTSAPVPTYNGTGDTGNFSGTVQGIGSLNSSVSAAVSNVTGYRNTLNPSMSIVRAALPPKVVSLGFYAILLLVAGYVIKGKKS